MLKKLIGNKAFYKRILTLMLPIMVQTGITNFVNMLDNVMIGAIGTAQMTGVSIANQLFFVFNLCVFGAVSGAGIFGAQFFGKSDHDGVRYTFRFKFIFGCFITISFILLMILFGEPLLKLYMQGDQGTTSAADTLIYAKSYMSVMLIGLLPYAVVQCYSGTLREATCPLLPMLAGVAAVTVNLVFNYILIFGKFGAPALGVTGAAIATVFSRFVELAIVIIFVHSNKVKYTFMRGVYRSPYIPAHLVKGLFVKSIPLLMSETLWSMSIATINQCYSLRGLDAVAACNINSTFWNVFSIAYMSLGSAVGIILGQMLGANQLKEAKQDSYKMIAFSFTIASAVAAVFFICANFIPLAYNTEPEIRVLATRLMQITALTMPFDALTHSSYFALRSGGKMLMTFIFDCGFAWFGSVFLAFTLSRFTSLSFIMIFAIVHLVSVAKGTVGVYLVTKGMWVKNITSK